MPRQENKLFQGFCQYFAIDRNVKKGGYFEEF